MKLKFGFSPCPNDTFIFDAIINGRVFQKGIEADPVCPAFDFGEIRFTNVVWQ